MNELDSGLHVRVYKDIAELDKVTYLELVERTKAPIFYQWEFLLASQESPLLPVEECVYFAAYRRERLVGFLQSYAMLNPDPFGVISRNTGIDLGQGSEAWLSHIMHFYESTVVCESRDFKVREKLLEALLLHGKERQAHCVGLMNVIDAALLNDAIANKWQVDHMWDRYYCDIRGMRDVDAIFEHMNRFGRNEMRRQLRKYSESEACGRILRPPFDEIESIAELCFETTKKNGTPHYYPPQTFCQFLRHIGKHALIFVIEQNDELIGALVCFEEHDTLHLWAGGMTYEKSEFSPYTILFYKAYEYAIKRGMSTMEAGRTNKKIKERLGFTAKPLYTILRPLQ